MSDNLNTIALSIKSSDRRRDIIIEDIRHLTKQKVYILPTIDELEPHIYYGIHILSIVFGQSSSLMKQLLSCQTYIKNNQSTNYDLLCQDNLFATKVFYVMDIGVQIFSRTSKKASSPLPLLPLP